MKNERNLFIDILKGIAIILVVLGHAIQYGSGEYFYNNKMYFSNIIFIFIYSFHMPLFMLISGYMFFFTTSKYSTVQVIISRFEKLLLPVFTFTVFIFTRWHVFAGKIFKNGIIYTIRSFISEFGNNLWFLWAVFIVSLIVLVVKVVFKDSLIIYLLIFILSFLYTDSANFACYKFMYPYFVAGYLFNKYKGKEFFNRMSWKSGIISGGMFVFLLIFYNYDSYIYTSGHCILGKDILKQLGIDMYRTLIGFVGSIFIILITKIMHDVTKAEKIKQLLGVIGRNSLGIYIFSSYVFAYILMNMTATLTNINYAFVIVETGIILGICLGITMLIRKQKMLSYIFLGGR